MENRKQMVEVCGREVCGREWLQVDWECQSVEISQLTPGMKRSEENQKQLEEVCGRRWLQVNSECPMRKL